MRLRGLSLTVLLLIGLSVLGAANVAPTMQDQYIATAEGSPVTFEIRAEDTDIDVTDSTSHPLTFAVVAGPTHGVLVGDLAVISYRPPYTAAVEVTYVPADGYVGSDFITLSVTDPLGEQAVGTMTVEIEIEARRTMGILSGNWNTGVTYNSQTSGFTAFRTRFTGVYRIGSLTMKGIASIQMETINGIKRMIFDGLRFQSDFTIAGFDHTSTLTFDPDAGGADLFDYWLASTRVSFIGINFTHTLYLPDSQTDSYQALSASTRLGAVSIANTMRFSMDASCGFPFTSNITSVAWSTCDVATRASIGFNCDGFDKFTLSASGIPVSGFGWLLGDVYLDASLRFDMDGKSFSASTYWRPGAIGCIKLLGKLDLSGPASGPVTGNTIYESIHIYGLKLECDIPSTFGNVRFVSATSFEPTYNSIVTGQTDYFEMFRFTGPLLSCCGYPGSWSTSTYFNTGATMLFDWGMTLIRADIAFSDHFNFSFETVFRSGFFGDPKFELSVGWMTRW
jgi:Big-like domain-containing protein